MNKSATPRCALFAEVSDPGAFFCWTVVPARRIFPHPRALRRSSHVEPTHSGGSSDDIRGRGKKLSGAKGERGAAGGDARRVLPDDGNGHRCGDVAGRGYQDVAAAAAGTTDRAGTHPRRRAPLELRSQPPHRLEAGPRQPRRRGSRERHPDNAERRRPEAPPFISCETFRSGQRATLRLRPRPIFLANCERAAA